MAMDIYNFIPKFIKQVLDNPPRYTVLATRWNELWNLVINQGDWNSEAIKMLCDTLAVAVSDYNTKILNHRTGADHDGRYYTETEINAFLAALATKAENALKADKTEVYTKTEIHQYLQGGDTIIRREVFTIITSDNGDGTFTYKDNSDVEHIGELGPNGEQIFTLQKGAYLLGEERIEAVINDTLERSVTSGGLQEVDQTHVALTIPEGAGAEITIKYFERIALVGLGLVNIGPTKPGVQSIWFEVVS